MDEHTLALVTFRAASDQLETAINALNLMTAQQALGFQRLADVLEQLPKPDFRTKQLTLVRVHDLESGITIEGEIKFMQLTSSQKCTIEFGQPVDKKGFPTQVEEGSVVFSIGDDTATVEQDATNPLKATVFAVHPATDPSVATVITVTADADLGDGVTNITGTEPLLVIAGQAVGFGPATVGTPEENEPPAPEPVPEPAPEP